MSKFSSQGRHDRHIISRKVIAAGISCAAAIQNVPNVPPFKDVTGSDMNET